MVWCYNSIIGGNPSDAKGYSHIFTNPVVPWRACHACYQCGCQPIGFPHNLSEGSAKFHLCVVCVTLLHTLVEMFFQPVCE